MRVDHDSLAVFAKFAATESCPFHAYRDARENSGTAPLAARLGLGHWQKPSCNAHDFESNDTGGDVLKGAVCKMSVAMARLSVISRVAGR